MMHDRTNDGDTLNRKHQQGQDSPQELCKLSDAEESSKAAMKRYAMLGGRIFWFASLDHGFLKVRHSLDSNVVHCTWTWSTGPNAGRYVYAAGPYHQVDYLLEVLARKLAEVDEGKCKAAPDKLGNAWTGRKV